MIDRFNDSIRSAAKSGPPCGNSEPPHVAILSGGLANLNLNPEATGTVPEDGTVRWQLELEVQVGLFGSRGLLASSTSVALQGKI